MDALFNRIGSPSWFWKKTSTEWLCSKNSSAQTECVGFSKTNGKQEIAVTPHPFSEPDAWNSPPEVEAGFSGLHKEYCRLTGLPLRYMPLEHDSDWYLWSKEFGRNDLELVVKWLKTTQMDKRILANQLSFRHLIRCRDYFAEYLAQAKADARKPRETERDRVLASAGRPQCRCGKPAKTTAQVMQQHEKMAKMLEQYRRETFGQSGQPVTAGTSAPPCPPAAEQPAAPSDSKP